jgi:hypothetical protein
MEILRHYSLFSQLWAVEQSPLYLSVAPIWEAESLLICLSVGVGRKVLGWHVLHCVILQQQVHCWTAQP